MKSLWLDIGNTRLKYWVTENNQVVEHAAELHLQSPADLLLGLIQHFKNLGIHQAGVSSVQDLQSNERIRNILKQLNVPIICAKVHAEYAGLSCGYDNTTQLGIDRWLQVLAVAHNTDEKYCVISCGTALTIDLADGLNHLGGYILPNLYLQRDSLIQNTKGIKIPDAAFDELSPGRNTIDAVHHGILLGLVSIIKNVLEQSPRKLILTGGDAPLFAKFLAEYNPIIEPDLLLQGLQKYILHQN
ncbi:type III pantothenate kinase [Acinetobacter portensis]|uniref:Type III pantothenate kinase n=2 Tax=Acinetobacter TaxID=469 RepID=A0ABU5GH28_9GAMM|nr:MULTISPECIES: type III pantothenate kinase [Acinetobacter]MCK7608260.1 type III pantothenate kinase [Acinetobacter portensis]MCK7638943.1 type III pantothenate kinase [Acinetobacter portensis]MDY6460813.1 type III pantothenate kinase [Acinetobacter faecalis]MDY6535602.1 type III pantothenate kinase [Acinetobacter faecalis]MDY6549846.1 type III pantothenate kinase [Acinetobacter faecalis]